MQDQIPTKVSNSRFGPEAKYEPMIVKCRLHMPRQCRHEYRVPSVAIVLPHVPLVLRLVWKMHMQGQGKADKLSQ